VSADPATLLAIAVAVLLLKILLAWLATRLDVFSFSERNGTILSWRGLLPAGTCII